MTMLREPESWQDQLQTMGFSQDEISRAAAAGVTDVSSAIDHLTSNPNPSPPAQSTSQKAPTSTALIAPTSVDQYPPLVPSTRTGGLTNARNSLDRMPRTSASSSRNNNNTNSQDTPMPASSPPHDDDLKRAIELSRKEQDEREMARAISISKQQEASAERDPQLIRALEESLNYNSRLANDHRNVSWQSHAFATPAERVRIRVDDPVGLRNIGNTCYLNSLIQVYYHLPPFRRAVMAFRPREDLLPLTDPAPPAAGTTAMSHPAREDDDQAERKSDTTADAKIDVAQSDVDMTPALAAPPTTPARTDGATAAQTPQQPQNSPVGDHASDKSENRSESRSVAATRHAVMFVVELQKLFAAMALGNQNCADPTAVLRAMRDPDGKPIEIGDQQDASEFNHLFLDIVEKGLQAEASAASTPAPSPGVMSPTDPADLTPDTASPLDAASPTHSNIVKDLFNVQFRQEVRSCPPPTDETDPRDEDMAPIVTDGETNCIIVDATSRDGRTLHNGLDDYAVARIDYKLPAPGDSERKSSEVTATTSPTKMDIARPNEGDASGGDAKSNGEVSLARPAMKRVWFSKIPPVMVIYLQRVRFNREKSLAEKVHSKYEFGTDISFDRYLEVNREVSAQARERVLGIRKERRRLLSIVKKYRYFPDGRRDRAGGEKAEEERDGGAEGSVPEEDEAMGEGTYFQAVDRIQERLQHAMQAGPGVVGACGLEHDEMEVAQRVVQRIAETDRKQCEAVEQSLKSLEDEREAYRHMEKEKYGLHAVLVHDGAPSGGHYWTFIRDWEASETDSRAWVKFSDSAVARVSQSDMLRWSLGGNGTASAYCLIYTGPSVAPGSGGKTAGGIAEESKRILPQARIDEVETAAQTFDKEVAQAKTGGDEQRAPPDTQQW